MSDIAIKIEGVSKKYTIGHQKDGSLRSALAGILKSTNTKGEDFWALNDITFDVKKGDVIGIIGKNGAGKSTLLKILSQITRPTKGRIEVNGRVASLLEVGTGFHPELTGRENIFLNGTILGMSRKEVKAKFDEIVAFSGVERFIDTPVKHYSSGMYVRLAFAVAAHLEPEILIIDEVLAVGDAEFQKKCLGKMDHISKTGRTILFVSHQMASIANLCNRGIVLRGGQVKYIGDTSNAIDLYIDSGQKRTINEYTSNTERSGKGEIKFIKSYLENKSGDIISSIPMGESFSIVLEYKTHKNSHNHSELDIKIGVFEMNGHRLSLLWNQGTNASWKSFPEHGIVKCYFNKFPLYIGSYYFNIAISHDGQLEDWIINAGNIIIESSDYFNSGRELSSLEKASVIIDQEWSLLDGEGVKY